MHPIPPVPPVGQPSARRHLWRCILAALVTASALRAAVVPATVFSEHAVLQQGRPVPVWGTAAPGESVAVAFAEHARSTRADPGGNWRVDLPPLAPFATGRDLVITGQNTVTVSDVVVGELWLASGQSNMAWRLRDDYDAALESLAAAHTAVRQFTVERTIGTRPAERVPGNWVVANAGSVGGFSAVAWYFAVAIHRAEGVPVGIINATWGNTPIEAWLPPAAGFLNPAPGNTEPYQAPGVLYHGMIHPLRHTALRGMLWYQGESNVAKSDMYGAAFIALIRHWREAFRQGDLPFYWVQLPGFAVDDPGGTAWARLREAQEAALVLPATGQAVTLDLGEARDIHPRRKRDVALRLARIALHRTYGHDMIDSGPLFESATPEAGKIRVRFSSSRSGLRCLASELNGFEIADEGGVFHAAEALLEAETVLLSCPDVAAPRSVRYGWRNLPPVSLYNAEGLPAAPFRAVITAPAAAVP